MDKNKLEKLRDVGYVVKKCCGTCIHQNFGIASNWGTCAIHQYDHAKHTQTKRQLSIYIYGCCPDHEAEPFSVLNGEHYSEFNEAS